MEYYGQLRFIGDLSPDSAVVDTYYEPEMIIMASLSRIFASIKVVCWAGLWTVGYTSFDSSPPALLARVALSGA